MPATTRPARQTQTTTLFAASWPRPRFVLACTVSVDRPRFQAGCGTPSLPRAHSSHTGCGQPQLAQPPPPGRPSPTTNNQNPTPVTPNTPPTPDTNNSPT